MSEQAGGGARGAAGEEGHWSEQESRTADAEFGDCLRRSDREDESRVCRPGQGSSGPGRRQRRERSEQRPSAEV